MGLAGVFLARAAGTDRLPGNEQPPGFLAAVRVSSGMERRGAAGGVSGFPVGRLVSFQVYKLRCIRSVWVWNL